MANKRTALYQEHLAAGAKMVPFAGHDMPIQYHSLKQEALAVRNSCGVFDVGHMGEFLFSGPDAISYVDYLICNDFARADMGKAIYSPLLREDGTIIDDLIAYKLQREKVLICVNGANIAKDWDWVQSQSRGFQVQLQDQSPQFSLLAVQGPQSKEVLREIGLPVGEGLANYSAVETQWRGQGIVLARTGYTGEVGFEIFLSHPSALALWRALADRGVCPCGLGARDVLRIEAGLPLYGQDIHDGVTPYDSGLKWAVKLEKKSFIGQDALRKYRPKYRPLKLILPRGIPRAGRPVLNQSGRVVGQVTSGTMSVILGKGIAMAHIESTESVRQKFVVNIRDRYYDAHPHQGPFVARGGRSS